MQQRKNDEKLICPDFTLVFSQDYQFTLKILNNSQNAEKTRNLKNPNFSDNYDKTKPSEILSITQLHYFQKENLNHTPCKTAKFLSTQVGQSILFPVT